MRAISEIPDERAVAFCDDALGRADATEIARRVRHGDLSAQEVVEAAIARADRVEPRINAIVSRSFDRARERASAAAEGALFGVPTFIKDTDAVSGEPMRFGSNALPPTPVETTSRFARQFLSTGLISLGKSSTPEFGLTGTTEPLLYGPTHNPWRLGFSSGGSSGGAAALVASGVVPIAHANDGGGSIRIPAACCGLVGLKPSRGRLADIEGGALFPIRITHQGVVSRSVRDTVAFYVAAEPQSRASSLPEIGQVRGPGRRLRIGFFSDIDDTTPAHPDCVAAVEQAARLCESLGHAVEPVARPFDNQFHEDFFLYWSTVAFAVSQLGKLVLHPRFDRTRLEPFTEGLIRYFRDNAAGVPASITRLRRFARVYARRFEHYDVLMNPTLAMPPPALGFIGPHVPFDTALERLKWFIPFTPLQNVSGTPALTLPLAQSSDGLPLGVQLASAMGADRTLLELATELEAAAPWPTLAGAPATASVAPPAP